MKLCWPPLPAQVSNGKVCPTSMNNFVINLFIPPTIEGSAVAVLAHMYANENDGGVSIVRCSSDTFANHEIQELLRHITMADGYNAPQPERREIWIVGFNLNEMVKDELVWFAGHKQGRKAVRFTTDNEAQILLDCKDIIRRPWSFENFIKQLFVPDNNYSLLYNMLEPDEYERLLAYLLREYPNAKDVSHEDYVLNMFVAHAKKAHLK